MLLKQQVHQVLVEHQVQPVVLVLQVLVELVSIHHWVFLISALAFACSERQISIRA